MTTTFCDHSLVGVLKIGANSDFTGFGGDDDFNPDEPNEEDEDTDDLDEDDNEDDDEELE